MISVSSSSFGDIYSTAEQEPLNHILIVEGDKGVADMLSWTLELAGYHATITHATGMTWIGATMQSAPPPALILLDLSDPDTRGADFLCHLRMQWGTIPPIIVLTTCKRIYNELCARERIVMKPFHIHDLLQAVQNIVPPLSSIK